MRNDTLVTTPLDADEAKQAKDVYVDSTEQPVTYKVPPHYACLVADLIASLQPQSVLEFGCTVAATSRLFAIAGTRGACTVSMSMPAASSPVANSSGSSSRSPTRTGSASNPPMRSTFRSRCR